MTYTAHSETLPNGYRVEVVADEESRNICEDWDMVGTMVLSSCCRYRFGHETAGNDEIQAILRDPKNIALPVYMYDHSGITINTTGFSCPWDSGMVGIMYCTREKAVQEFGKKLCTKKVESAAVRCMIDEVKSIDDTLTGNVWGFQIFDAEGKEVDACWGFVGDSKYCFDEAMAAAKHYGGEA